MKHTLCKLAPVGIFSSTVFVAFQAYALPLGAEVFPQSIPADDITQTDTDFKGTVALNNCSGSLVRFSTSVADDKALILTNGHCYEGGFLKAGQAIANVPSTRAFKLLSESGEKIATLTAERVLYATMTGTDMTLYKLEKTFAAIKNDNGIDALTLSEHHPDAGTPIRVVSGYWRKIYSCSIDKFVPQLQEGKWTFSDSLKYSRPGCNTIGGTSGSPIVNALTGEVIGVNNTGNEHGKHCTENNPCEVDAAGKVTVEKGASYGQETYQIYSCLTADNSLNLNLPGCALTKPQ